MTEHDNGGLAFPREHSIEGHDGMSLRDYFAAKALQGLCAHISGPIGVGRETPVQAHARAAYEYADAMLKARAAAAKKE